MNAFEYIEKLPPSIAGLARAWLQLGIFAIAGAGVLALLLVSARTPGVAQWLPWQDFFRTTLIVHVDLSVLAWFLAFAATLWSLAGNTRWLKLGWAGVWLALIGIVCLLISPFLADARPSPNNYVPVLQQRTFIAGLLLLGAGYACALCRMLQSVAAIWRARQIWRQGAWLAALCGTLALSMQLIAWLLMPEYSGQAYFETLFWSGGHILQFQHGLLLLVAWWLLLDSLDATPAVSPWLISLGFTLAALPVWAAPWIFWQGGAPGSAAHLIGFARLMQYGHLFMLPLLLLLVWAILRHLARLPRGFSQLSPQASALLASALLFAVGGVLGYLIRGANVVIPAHYHGAIVGITLAFMGLSFVLLPRLGYAPVDVKLARLQPLAYGGGQLLHVLGLTISGGYGVARKIAGAEQVLVSLPQQIGMGLMGLGGLIAILGGVLFVWVAAKSMWRGQRHR